MKITIAHLYPDLLNLYGDNGNISALKYRLDKRGIETEIIEYDIKDDINFENADIVFIGGGSDRELKIVCERLKQYKEKIIEYAENNGCLLAICGGFQLLGKYYTLADEKIEGIGLLDIYSEYSPERFTGDIMISSEITDSEIVGFENHSGRMNIGNYKPLGKVLYGHGNNSEGKDEGILYKNVIGSYLHGPLLPKNPALTDYIISKALENKYGSSELKNLDDTIEILAHDYIVNKLKSNK